MNGSMYTADRNTHLKVVVTALCAAIVIAVAGIGVRMANPGNAIFAEGKPGVVLPSQAPIATAGDIKLIR